MLCPCWVGEDPDGDTCEAIDAWHFDKGTINGVDVSGLSLGSFVHIPSNVLESGSWKVVLFVDENADAEQQEALLSV